MKILNYGAGAVGLGLDSCLLKASERVDLIAREKTVASLKDHGLIRSGLFEDFKAAPQSFGAYASLDDLPLGPYDLILVTTKSFDSEAAAKDLSSHPSLFSPRTKIVLFQNGWGNAEIFCRYFPEGNIYSARVITGFCRPEPHEVNITVHADDIRIGSLFNAPPENMEKLCETISRGGLPCRTVASIARDIWAKMLYNCALNPLGAILDVPYGALAENLASREIMETILQETFLVMKAAGYETHWKTPKAYMKIFYEQLVPSTARHHSSTLQDLKAGKRTEIEALNGMVCRLGQANNLSVAANRMMTQMIKFIEVRNMAGRACMET